MTPSKYQIAIYEAAKNSDNNLMVEAVAGSGKSTTIVNLVDQFDNDASILVVAFNKDIVKSIQPKISHPMAKVCTLNSFGNTICRQQLNINDLRSWKSEETLKGYFDMNDEKERKKFYKYKGTINRLTELFRANLIFVPSEKDTVEIAENYGLDIPEKENEFQEFYNIFKNTYLDCINNTRIIDFRDQVFFPIYHNLNIPKYDVVLVDEVQDLDRNQAELVIQAASRLIMVGDSKQAIYGFRGAMATAMKELGDRTNATQLPLSVCYRCPTKALEMAKAIVPQIEPCDWAPEGKVSNDLKIEDFRKEVREGDYVMCRCVAPLVSECFALIREGKKAMVKGRDIGEQLISLIRKIESGSSIEQFIESLNKYFNDKYEGFIRTGKEELALNLKDRVDTILVLAEDAKSVYDIEKKIRDIFKDDVSGTVFLTVHKAKGLENPRIFILAPDLMPHPAAKKEWQREQEMNLKYVALTRVKFTVQCKGELYFVPIQKGTSNVKSKSITDSNVDIGGNSRSDSNNKI